MGWNVLAANIAPWQVFATSNAPWKMFSTSNAPREVLQSIHEEENEQNELLDQQRMLQEQRRRLLDMSGACSVQQAGAQPLPQKPMGAWNQHKEQSPECARQGSEAEMKPHNRT